MSRPFLLWLALFLLPAVASAAADGACEVVGNPTANAPLALQPAGMVVQPGDELELRLYQLSTREHSTLRLYALPDRDDALLLTAASRIPTARQVSFRIEADGVTVGTWWIELPGGDPAGTDNAVARVQYLLPLPRRDGYALQILSVAPAGAVKEAAEAIARDHNTP